MGKTKVLNLYAGIGGNRKLWPSECEVTAVEINPEIAEIYQDHFPDDEVIVADAHEYLLEHYDDGWDFIWSSPPCQSHSKARWIASKMGDYPPIYPSMKLYQEILLLNNYFQEKWVVENVISYYQPLMSPQKIHKHYFWANFFIENKKLPNKYHFNTIEELQEQKGINISEYKGIDKGLLLRNCVNSKLGLHVFNCAFKERQQTLEVDS